MMKELLKNEMAVYWFVAGCVFFILGIVISITEGSGERSFIAVTAGIACHARCENAMLKYRIAKIESEENENVGIRV